MGRLTISGGAGGGISSDETTVKKEYVLNGYTYLGSDTNDDIGTGTMANNGITANQNLNCGGSFTVKKGYNAADYTVTANSLASQTDGTATDADILKDKTAFVDGVKVTGAMANNGAVTPAALGAGGSYRIPGGFHNGQGIVSVKSLSELTASGTVTDGNQMLSGYKAYSKGTLYTGTIASLAGGTYSYSTTSKTIACKGKYMTSDIIINTTGVQSILSFSFASRNYHTANFKWQNPAKGPFYGIVVRGKQGSYPTSITDGTAIYTGYGTNKTASGTSYSGFQNVGTGTWYFNAYSYFILNGSNVYSTAKQTSATFNCYNCTSYCNDWTCEDGCDDCCDGDCGDHGCNDGCDDCCDNDCGCYGPGECSDCNDGGCSDYCSDYCYDCSDGCDNCDTCNNCSKYNNMPAACVGN